MKNTRLIKSTLLLATIILGFSSSLIAQTYTFTNCGINGSYGPTQGDVNTAYAATNLNGMVAVNSQGIQEWVVPITGNYIIQAIGATAGNSMELAREVGRPANMNGEFMLTAGQTLKILVGQHGFLGSTRPGWGAGGGSFVALLNDTPLLIAGGCGAVHTDLGGMAASNLDNYASLTETGHNGQGGVDVWPDGFGAIAGQGGDGAGFYGDGTIGNGATYMLPAGLTVHTLPMAFVNGGNGDEIGGGFGGGGGVTNTYGGGGGGYSGGQGGLGDPYQGGGGASFNSGTNQNNYLDLNNLFVEAHGLVVISMACSPTMITANAPTLADVNAECSANPTPPTATNDCGSIINGTPDVSMPVMTQGTTVVTWTYDDGGGNVTTQMQNIILNDVTAPVPDMASLPDTTYDCVASSLVDPSATDNCGGAVIVTNDASLPITTSGLTVVTWTYDDGNGNTSTQTQNIYVNTVDNGVVLVGAQLNATGLGSYYQWLDCDNAYAAIPGAVNQFYTPPSSGNYAVEVTQGNCVDTSVCLLADFSGIGEIGGQMIVIHPNPSLDGMVNIDYEGEIKQIMIVDLLGRIIDVPVDLANGVIDASAISNGEYIIRVATDLGGIQKKLILLK